MGSNNNNEVLLHCEQIIVELTALRTSKERQVHGPDLIIYGSPNVFAARDEPNHTLSLPCGKERVVLRNLPPMRLFLKDSLSHAAAAGTVLLDPLACLVFHLTSRHCKSDQGEEVCHTYGYGQLALAEFLRPGIANVSVRLTDTPAQFETVYAATVASSCAARKTPVPADMDTLLNLQKHYSALHNGEEFFERAVITFVQPSVVLPRNVQAIPRAVGSRVVVQNPTDPRYWDMLARDTNGAAALSRYVKEFAHHRDLTYEPYSGHGRFEGWKAMDPMWASYFVPTYRLGCQLDMPSSLACTLALFAHTPSERLYLNIFRAQLERRGMSDEDFSLGCRAVLSAHGTWAEEARGAHGSSNPHQRMEQLPPDDPRVFHRHHLTHDERRCLDVAVQALASMAAACSYTTDFAEVPRATVSMIPTKGPRKVAEVGGVLPIVTEQFETAPLRTKAIDCEDGAAWVFRLWYSLVTNKGAWQHPVVAMAARVLDLYVVSINKMHCGECHILCTFLLRDYAYARMMAGSEHLHAHTSSTESMYENQKWAQGIKDTCFWPAYMYNGEPGSLQHRTDVQEMLKNAHWPVPHILYAESTRASPADQCPHDAFVYHSNDRENMRVHGTRTSACVSATRELCAYNVDLFRGLEPYVTFPEHMSCEAASREPTKLSSFYRGFIVGSVFSPVYKLVLEDLRACEGQPALSFPKTDAAMQRAHYFCDTIWHDTRRPHTFGAYHADVAGNRDYVHIIPYAPLTRALLVCVAKVWGIEAPIVPGLVPEHLRHANLERLGRMELMPHLNDSEVLLPHLKSGGMHMSTRHTGQQAEAGLLYSEFLPHNNCIANPDVLLKVVQSVPGHKLRGVYAARIPLAVAPVARSRLLSADDEVVARKMLTDMQMDRMDPTQYAALLPKEVLTARAMQLHCLERYSVEQWDMFRHYLGAVFRALPLYMNILVVVTTVM